MGFTLKIGGGSFDFELDENGMVWHVPISGIKNGIEHESTKDVEVAKKIAQRFLYSSGLINND